MHTSASLTSASLTSLHGERAFARLRRGRSAQHALLRTRWLANNEPSCRAGFVVSKKVGNAVVRNRVRRRLREALRAILAEHATSHSAFDVIIIAKPAAATADYWQLKAALEQTLVRSHLLELAPQEEC
jgi:ribonuclease P protein component